MATAIYAEVLVQLEHMTRLNPKILLYCTRLAVLTVASIRVTVLWYVTPYSLVDRYPRFEKHAALDTDVDKHLPDCTTI